MQSFVAGDDTHESSRCAADDMELGPFRGLTGPKRLWIAALFWLVGGWAGLHRLYLGDQPRCLLVGWLEDGWRLASMVDAANGRGARQGAGEYPTRVVRPLRRTTHAAFVRNRVSNTKYGNSKLQMWLLFFPLSLHEQMKYFTNRYFTLIAVLQLDSYITPTHPATTWIPLLVIFLFTAVRELVDDRQRLAGDTVANERTYHVASAASKPAAAASPDGVESHCALPAGAAGFRAVAAQDIQVGDIVVVKCDEEVPCDMVLLRYVKRAACRGNRPCIYFGERHRQRHRDSEAQGRRRHMRDGHSSTQDTVAPRTRKHPGHGSTKAQRAC
jgi:hypothetical protein